MSVRPSNGSLVYMTGSTGLMTGGKVRSTGKNWRVIRIWMIFKGKGLDTLTQGERADRRKEGWAQVQVKRSQHK